MKKLKISIPVFSILALLFFLPRKEKTNVFMAGDSTMCLYEPSRAPLTGWGMPFATFFDTTVFVANHARGGRSTRTFINEGRWKAIVDSLNPGDYVLIQFGHNDEAKEEKYRDRYTPVGDYKLNLEKFIRESKQKNAYPVLITPVSRLRFKDGRAIETHKEYSAAVLEVGTKMNVPVIDLDAASRELYNEMGPDAASLLFMQLDSLQHPNYPQGQKDNTHFSEYGARRVAELVLAGIRKKVPELAKRVIVRPSKK